MSTFPPFIFGGEAGVAAPRESNFEKRLIKEIKQLFPGAIVSKLRDTQGIPDRLILYGSKWAALEIKRELGASHRPNQDWYVEKMDQMSFSRFVYPENKDEVLQALIDFFSGQERTDKK